MKLVRSSVILFGIAISACGHDEADKPIEHVEGAGVLHTVQASSVADVMWVPAVARPRVSAVLSTKLMGSVTAVHVREGDMVRAGQAVVTIDARDLSAKDAQVQASIAEAEAMQREAATNAARLRALHAEEAATRAQLDGAETALARSEAGVRAAHAARSELAAARSYSVVRAPFGGLITGRMVHPGAFAAPGTPLISIEDSRQLRVTGTVTPEGIRSLKRGARVAVRIESADATGVVEGIVPGAGNLYQINIMVDNPDGRLLAGAAASIAVPQAMRTAICIPGAAVERAGDLTGVRVGSDSGSDLRWVQLGGACNDGVEVLAGLRGGEQIVVPAQTAGAN